MHHHALVSKSAGTLDLKRPRTVWWLGLTPCSFRPCEESFGASFLASSRNLGSWHAILAPSRLHGISGSQLQTDRQIDMPFPSWSRVTPPWVARCCQATSPRTSRTWLIHQTERSRRGQFHVAMLKQEWPIGPFRSFSRWRYFKNSHFKNKNNPAPDSLDAQEAQPCYALLPTWEKSQKSVIQLWLVFPAWIFLTNQTWVEEIWTCEKKRIATGDPKWRRCYVHVLDQC